MEVIEEKIQRIAKEIQEAGAGTWTITKIVKELTQLGTISEKKLNDKALELLKELDQNAAVVYERFSKMVVYASNEKSSKFNRGNIVESLLKETTLPRSAAEKITSEVENQIKDSKIKFLTPSLIRELVNAKLISYGFEEARDNYSRMGEPASEVKRKIENAAYYGETVREYNILLELPKKARELHFNGTIFIEDLEGYSGRPYAYSFIAKEGESAQKTILSSLNEVNKNSKYFYLQPSIYGLTFALGGFAKNNIHAKKIAEQITELQNMLPEKPLISLELFTPKALEKLDSQRLNAAKIANCLLEEKVIVGVDSKYSLKLLEAGAKRFTVLNNSAEEYYPFGKKLFSPTQGISLYVNINLEKSEAESESEVIDFLAETSEHITELKNKKMELLLKRSYLKDFKISEMKTAIGITSLAQLSERIAGQKQPEFTGRIYKELSKLFENDLLFGLSSEKVRKRFSEVSGKEVYSQEKLGFEECLKEKKCCFIGNATNLKELHELLDKKVKQIEYIGQNL